MKTRSDKLVVFLLVVFYTLMKGVAFLLIIFALTIAGYINNIRQNPDKNIDRFEQVDLTGMCMADFRPENDLTEILEKNNVRVTGPVMPWIQGETIYYVSGCGGSTCTEVYELVRIDLNGKNLTRTKLGGERETWHMRLIKEQPYVDKTGALHIFFWGYHPEDGKALDYWICTFDDSGNLIEKKNFYRTIHNMMFQWDPVKEAWLLPGDKFLFSDGDKKIMMLDGDGKVILNAYAEDWIDEIYITEDGRIIVKQGTDEHLTELVRKSQ